MTTRTRSALLVFMVVWLAACSNTEDPARLWTGQTGMPAARSAAVSPPGLAASSPAH